MNKIAISGYLAALIIAVIQLPLCAELPPVSVNNQLSVSATTNAECQVGFSSTISLPFMRTNSAMTAFNGFDCRFDLSATPVSFKSAAVITFTPVAFFQLQAGCGAGTGWNLPFTDTGMSLSTRKADGSFSFDDAAGGIVWNVKGGVILRGDLAAFVPGVWNHVVFQTFHCLQYRAFTGASSGETWVYECEWPENVNGWNYYGNVYIGYRMPLRLNSAGILIEADKSLETVSGGSRYGHNETRWTYDLMASYALTSAVTLNGVVQMHSVIDLENDPDGGKRYTNEGHLAFYRFVLGATVTL